MPAWVGNPRLRDWLCGVPSPDGRFVCKRAGDHDGTLHWQYDDDSDVWVEWWSDAVSSRKPIDVPL